MSEDTNACLKRIEQLLQEGNQLRRQSLEMQAKASERQESLIDEQRSQLARAAQVTDAAQALQTRARWMMVVVIPLLAMYLLESLISRFFS